VSLCLKSLSHFNHSSCGGFRKRQRLNAIYKLAILSVANISKSKFPSFSVLEGIFVERHWWYLKVGAEKCRWPKHSKVGGHIVYRLTNGSSSALNCILRHSIPLRSVDTCWWLALGSRFKSYYATASSGTSDAAPNVGSDCKWNALSSNKSRVTPGAPTACSCRVKGVKSRTIDIVGSMSAEHKLRQVTSNHRNGTVLLD